MLLNISPIPQLFLNLLCVSLSHTTYKSPLSKLLKDFSNKSEPLFAPLDLGLIWFSRPSLSNFSSYYSELNYSITTYLFFKPKLFPPNIMFNRHKPIIRLDWIDLQDISGTYSVKFPLHRFSTASFWGLFLLNIM